MILVWRVYFSKHGGGCRDVFAIVVDVEDILKASHACFTVHSVLFLLRKHG